MPQETNQNTYEHVYLALQPIFDRLLKAWGHELLYRDTSDANTAVFINQEEATLRVLETLPLCLLPPGAAPYLVVNFPGSAIMNEIYLAYPAARTIVQVDHGQKCPPGLEAQITKLREMGYRFCLDNFEPTMEETGLCHLADFITIDLLNRSEKKIDHAVQTCKTKYPKARLIAKRIEAYDQYYGAKALGFSYFQGYFFQRPQTASGKKLSGSQIARMKILATLQNPDADYDDICKALDMDVTIVHRLLVYANSPALRIRRQVESLREALVVMGIEALKKWLQIITLTESGSDSPSELVFISARRACFLELLAKESGHGKQAGTFFMLGLLSLLDALLDHRMADLLGFLSLAPGLEAALLNKPSKYSKWLSLAKSMEQAQWVSAEKLAGELELEVSLLRSTQAQAQTLAQVFFTT